MSTFDHLGQLVREGKLYEYKPLNTHKDFQLKRKLYVCEEVYNRCPPTDSGGSKKSLLPEEARYALREVLKAFVGGGMMEEGIQIKFLNPPPNQIWQLKVVPASRQNQARLFGWFIDYDTFVATHVVMRSELKTRRVTDDWIEQMQKCDEKRSRICSQLPILDCGPDISAYLSNARTGRN